MSLPILIGIALSTLVSEDLGSVAAALLVREGAVPLFQATAACVAGVYAGDLGLWWVGRLLGRRVFTLPWVASRLNPAAVSAFSARIDSQLGASVVLSRFVPGSRLPVYLAAGLYGQRPLAFAAWSFLAVLLWTPLLVVATARLGAAVVTPLLQGLETGILGLLLTGAILFGVLALTGRITGRAARRCQQRFAQPTETLV